LKLTALRVTNIGIIYKLPLSPGYERTNDALETLDTVVTSVAWNFVTTDMYRSRHSILIWSSERTKDYSLARIVAQLRLRLLELQEQVRRTNIDFCLLSAKARPLD